MAGIVGRKYFIARTAAEKQNCSRGSKHNLRAKQNSGAKLQQQQLSMSIFGRAFLIEST